MNTLHKNTGEGGPWDGFLHRPTPTLEAVAHRHRPHLEGRRILVTGASGSIGSALFHTLTLAAADPIPLDLAGPTPTDVTDPDALDRIFSLHRPEIVLHAAARKHVPEGETTPFAVLATNALGTRTLATVAARHAVRHLLLVSTDKAADPVSLMGASKRIAELILLASPRTHAVRLANVLGSSASVVPTFLAQISQGGPVTVTHPDARRYFMTLPETVDSILTALHLPGLLAPDPGPPIRILDLARHLIAQSPHPETPITFTTLRPGDKLQETLLAADETLTENPGFPLRTIHTPTPQPDLSQLEDSILRHDLPQLLDAVQSLVPRYRPSQLLRNQLTQAVPA
ncbi:hypothetical protein GCM10011507_15170 [Edaphobacter acidisoli]|uniref:Polysaccharide biosynthesis protein CapD-like domain-containing protein n=1 Tax=Edaphobacter acidisoli TaxID=2040573 RepID=A0A916RRN9_9BACT|nr:polysaccharide biosynthesis protein [Edaphobacter acidisoli]GGA64518.1 hypothetical protein GCM10011507_15170 [Edaphobacter acidisoli]